MCVCMRLYVCTADTILCCYLFTFTQQKISTEEDDDEKYKIDQNTMPHSLERNETSSVHSISGSYQATTVPQPHVARGGGSGSGIGVANKLFHFQLSDTARPF